MITEAFFDSIIAHYQNNLPFVVYSMPNNKVLKGVFQKDDTLHTIKDYTEQGFVFAPFNDENDSVLIPLEYSNFIETDYQTLNIDFVDYDNPLYNYNDLKKQHIKLITKGLEHLKSNKLTKVVLSRVEQHKIIDMDLITIFNALLKLYSSAFVYCWYHPKVGLWLGATPETLLSLQNNKLTTMSLAGTQPLEDFAHVFWGDKDVEEQQYVTDYIIKSITPIVKNIEVSAKETIQAGDLLHLKTSITATLSNNINGLKQLINVLHPTPAICGIPKSASKAFILENENYDREFYTGFLGELNYKKTTSRNNSSRNIENNAYKSVTNATNLFVNLRCMKIKNRQAHIYVGGGIISESVPEFEWEETVNKAMTMLKVI